MRHRHAQLVHRARYDMVFAAHHGLVAFFGDVGGVGGGFGIGHFEVGGPGSLEEMRVGRAGHQHRHGDIGVF